MIRALRWLSPGRLRRLPALWRERRNLQELHRIAASGRPIVAGPWTGSVRRELMQWIALLNWLTEVQKVDPARIVAVSRGGADPWYAAVAGRYVDVKADGEPDERRIAELVDALPGEGAERLVPDVLDRVPHAACTLQRALPEGAAPGGLPGEEFVAVCIEFSPCFPDSEENRRFLDGLFAHLLERTTVVVLPSRSGYEPPDEPGVVDGRDLVPERTALGAQTEIIRRAVAFVGSYGDLAFVGPYVGTPTVAFYSAARLDVAELDHIERIGRRLGQQRRLFRARHVGHLAVARASTPTP